MTEGNGSGASESGTGMYDCRTLILYIKMYPMGMWMVLFFWFLNVRANGRRNERKDERKDERTDARHTRARTSTPVDTAREDRFIEPSRECDSRARGERDEGDDESTGGIRARAGVATERKRTDEMTTGACGEWRRRGGGRR